MILRGDVKYHDGYFQLQCLGGEFGCAHAVPDASAWQFASETWHQPCVLCSLHTAGLRLPKSFSDLPGQSLGLTPACAAAQRLLQAPAPAPCPGHSSGLWAALTGTAKTLIKNRELRIQIQALSPAMICSCHCGERGGV